MEYGGGYENDSNCVRSGSNVSEPPWVTRSLGYDVIQVLSNVHTSELLHVYMHNIPGTSEVPGSKNNSVCCFHTTLFCGELKLYFYQCAGG